MALTKALVDPWQRKWTATSLATQNEPMKASSQDGPVVTLTATVEERFVNTLISRDGELNYVPLTTNLGLKYKRRTLYFPMDSGELTLDGLVDTGAYLARSQKLIYVRRLLAPQSIIKEGPAPNF